MTLQELIDNKEVLYIYEIGLQIYGLFPETDDRDYLIIVSDKFCVDKELYDNYTFYNITDWFDMVLNNRMIAWICACLPKKFVIKEYVKLLLQTNPLQLRKEFDAFYKYKIDFAKDCISEGNSLTGQKALWDLISYLKFANQIIENHKIVNFKDVAEDYRQIVNGQVDDESIIMNTFYTRLNTPLTLFKNYTDGVLNASKIKKIVQS